MVKILKSCAHQEKRRVFHTFFLVILIGSSFSWITSKLTVYFCWSIFLQVVAKSSNVFPKDAEAPPFGVDDMTKLAFLQEPVVLHNLKTRYDINEIYVCFFVSFLHLENSSLPLITALINKTVKIYWGHYIRAFSRLTGEIYLLLWTHSKDCPICMIAKGAAFGELSLHPFAVADAVYSQVSF